MTRPAPGDRVKITVEGPVFAVDELGRFVEVGTEAQWFTVPILTSGDGTVQAECFVIPPPMPEWRAGDVLDVVLESGVTERYGVLPQGQAVALGSPARPFYLADRGIERLWANGRVTVVARANG